VHALDAAPFMARKREHRSAARPDAGVSLNATELFARCCRLCPCRVHRIDVMQRLYYAAHVAALEESR